MINTDENKNTPGAEPSQDNAQTNPPAANTGGEAKKDEVKVSKKTLDSILDRIESLEADNKKKDEKIEMLTNISDKARLAKYEEQNRAGSLIRTARVSFWKGLPVIGWQTVKDEVGFIDGRLRVNQVIRLFMQVEGEKEPKSEEVEYLYWSQNIDGEAGEVVSRNHTKDGEFWTIEFKDGKKVTLDIRFINAF